MNAQDTSLHKAIRPDADFVVEPIEVMAVNRPAERQLYASRQKIYPRLAHGRFRTLKWMLMAVALGVYYALPWLRWHRGTELPDQAVLIDVTNGRLFFFGLEIWPQELYLVTGLLVIAALGLFLVTSLFGRVWCGYFCPQTVWTDLMIAVERLWQGDRNARIRLDKEPWGPVKIFKKTMTHLTWLAVAVATGGALVFYFRDAPTLARELVTGEAPAISYLFLGIFAFTTYLLGGIAREQVCIYMCPWPRIQGAMFDSDSLLVSYREFRGEPRGPLRKSQGWEGRGDCIDCKACVAVCPMGIDIRDGAQLECIQCALCIDACDDIMDKVRRPRGLIAYDTFRNLEAGKHGERARIRLLRPRTVLYSGLVAIACALTLWATVSRAVVELNVLSDRSPLYVTLSDGSIRNAYTVKILSKRYDTRTFALRIEGLAGAGFKVLGAENEAVPKVEVPPDTLREVRVFVTVDRASLEQLPPARANFRFVAEDAQDGTTAKRESDFRRP
ncbi:MAG: cytochrome c oxidase accessory protein CcoG [Hyphomicrobiaceae bacterium]